MLNKKPSSRNLVLIGIIIVMVAVAGCLIYISKVSREAAEKAASERYSVVSTISGEFYVGKLSQVPNEDKVKLTNAFILQNVKTSATDAGSLQLIPLSQSLWMPEAVYFNSENIVFSGFVGADSQVAKTIKDYENGVAPAAPAANQQPAPKAPAVKK